MMSETELKTALEAENMGEWCGGRADVSGTPRLGRRVEIEYSANSGGAFRTSGPSTISGELLYVDTWGSDSLMFVARDDDAGRAVAFTTFSKTLKSLAARKTKRGQRIGNLISVTFTDEDVSALSPAMVTLGRVRSGDTVEVAGDEYGVVSVDGYGPEDARDKFKAVLTTCDGDEFQLVASAAYSVARVEFGPRWDDREQMDANEVRAGRFRERYWNRENEGLDTVDTTDAFPAPHGAREGDRLTFALTDEDGEPDEQVSGTVTDVRYYAQTGRGSLLSDPEEQPPQTTVELDDGREVQLKNTGRRSHSWVTGSRREKMDGGGMVKAFVIRRYDDEDRDSEFSHVEAVDIQPEPEVRTDGGEPEDGEDASAVPEVAIPDGERGRAGCFHRMMSPCVFLLQAYEPKPVNVAQARGYTRCSQCKPPVAGFQPDEGEDRVMTDGGEPEVEMPGEDSSGEHYHRVLSPCSFDINSTERVTLSEAISEGYTACQMCDPPAHGSDPDEREVVTDGGTDTDECCPDCSVPLEAGHDRMGYAIVRCPECERWKRPGWGDLCPPPEDLRTDGGFNPAAAPPPTITREEQLRAHTPTGTRMAGTMGTIPERSGNGVLLDRDSHSHRLRALDAYAISTSVLDRMEQADADYILIRETDTGDVYEWVGPAWYYADRVPDRYLETPEDPQRFCPRDSARAVWRDHGEDVVREREDGERLMADGGQDVSEGVTNAADVSDEDRHAAVKRRVIPVEGVVMVKSVGEDGRFLAVYRREDVSEDALEQYRLGMDLADYVELNADSVDALPEGVSGPDITVDVWKQQAMTDGGRDAAMDLSALTLSERVERALWDGGLMSAVDISERSGGVRLTFSGVSMARVSDALPAGLSWSGRCSRVGPDAADVCGTLFVAEDAGGEGDE